MSWLLFLYVLKMKLQSLQSAWNYNFMPPLRISRQCFVLDACLKDCIHVCLCCFFRFLLQFFLLFVNISRMHSEWKQWCRNFDYFSFHSSFFSSKSRHCLKLKMKAEADTHTVRNIMSPQLTDSALLSSLSFRQSLCESCLLPTFIFLFWILPYIASLEII